jgi:hypothetical protein
MAACAGLLAFFFPHADFAERVTREVPTGVPIGTPRTTAEAWLTEQYGAFYGHYKGPGLVGPQRPKMLLDAVAIAEDVPGGVVIERVRKRRLLERLLDRLHHEEVWVFLLLDADDGVQDYRFMSYPELLSAREAHDR